MKYFLVLVVVLISGLLLLGFLLPKKLVVKKENSSFDFEIKKENKETLLFFVGDIMLDRGVKSMVKKNGRGDFKFPFLKISDYLSKADILFGNLESIISDKGRKIGSIYSFRAEPEAIEGLKYAGFDILSLANNHALDYTSEALKDCFSKLEKAGISYVGAGNNEKEAFSLKIKEVNPYTKQGQVAEDDKEDEVSPYYGVRAKGTKIGFLAFTNLGPEIWRAGKDSPGIAWIDEESIEDIKKIIKSAKEKVDILVVSLHAGQEYKKEPSDFQISFSKNCIDNGADLVIGHHSHVVQPIEKYKQGWIAYSLGNFIFDQSFSEETMKGLLLQVIIEGKKIKNVNSKEIRISNSFQLFFY